MPNAHSRVSGVIHPRPTQDELLDFVTAQRGIVYQTGTNVINRVYDIVYLQRPIGCEYIADCTTNAPYRKCISHFFGRNKKCTRIIPEYLWVHLCRKHYQRARYRNAVEWAAIQCILVINQVSRILAWCQKNEAESKGPVLLGWKLTLRKREIDRLNSKRKRDDQAQFLSLNDAAAESSINSGRSIPSWLQQYFPAGDEEPFVYQTEEIIKIFTDIKKEVENGNVSVIPDIECLPQFRGQKDDDEDDTPKGKTEANKKQKRSGHSSSSSLSSGSRQSSGRRSSGSEGPALIQYQFGHSAPTFTGSGLQLQGHQQITAAGNRLPRTTVQDFTFGIQPAPGQMPVPGPLPVPTSSAFNGPSHTAGGPIGNQGYNAARPAHHRSMSAAVNSFNGGSQPAGGQPTQSYYGTRQFVQLPDLPQQARPSNRNSYGGVPSGPNTGSALPIRPAPANTNSSDDWTSSSYREGALPTRPAPANTIDSDDWPFSSYQSDVHQQLQSLGSLMNYSQPANTGGAYGGAAKHMRHHSTPVLQHNAAGSANSNSFLAPPPLPSINYQLHSNQQGTQGNSSLPIRSNPQGTAPQTYYSSYPAMQLPATSRDQANGNEHGITSSQDPATIGGVTGFSPTH